LQPGPWQAAKPTEAGSVLQEHAVSARKLGAALRLLMPWKASASTPRGVAEATGDRLVGLRAWQLPARCWQLD